MLAGAMERFRVRRGEHTLSAAVVAGLRSVPILASMAVVCCVCCQLGCQLQANTAGLYLETFCDWKGGCRVQRNTCMPRARVETWSTITAVRSPSITGVIAGGSDNTRHATWQVDVLLRGMPRVGEVGVVFTLPPPSV
jgi:hypothetical protein